MADDKEPKFHYGGQAVIEGVMMRGPKDFTVAVRRMDGELVSTTESLESVTKKLGWLNKPFLRGILAFIDAMYLGIKSLKYSADVAMEDAVAEDNKRAGKEVPADGEQPKKSGVNDMAVGLMMVLGLLGSIALFKFIPIVITKQFDGAVKSDWKLSAIEGLVMIGIFIGYVALISLLKDIRRVFQYHGAEHKTINAYEAGEVLTVENVIKYPKEHVRCGTSFILVVLFTSIIVMALVVDHLPFGSLSTGGVASYFARWGYKLIFLPFIAGISYEVIRLAGNHKDSFFARMLVVPGLIMQRITTREPEPEMLEVAIRSLEGVLKTEAAAKEKVDEVV